MTKPIHQSISFPSSGCLASGYFNQPSTHSYKYVKINIYYEGVNVVGVTATKESGCHLNS